jgi:hypothetical protein
VSHSISPPELLRDPKFKAPNPKALGPLAGEKWLSSLAGPAPEVKARNLAGTAMQLASVCKPHDCAGHNTVVLYDSARPAVHGKVYQAGRNTLLGNPAPAAAAEPDKLLRQEGRSGR